MPNHLHGIIWVDKWDDKDVGNCHGNSTYQQNIDNQNGNDDSANDENITEPNRNGHGRSLRQFELIPTIINGFKSSVTRTIRQQTDPEFVVWQKSFHDRIIHDNEELNCIREYIQNNPRDWANDDNNLNIK